MSEEKERECKCEPHFEMPQEVMCSRCHEPLGEHYKPKDKEFAVPISEWNKLVDEKFTLKEQIKSLESRLAQEHATVKSQNDCIISQEKKIQSLEHRLSHLMDVAGRLVEPLKAFVFDEITLKENHFKEAKLALAEWDGRKEKK